LARLPKGKRVKILIDPIYTGKAHKCSTSYLAWEIIEGLRAKSDDVFFYLMYPEASKNNEEEWKFLNRRPDCVHLVPYPYLQADRVEEQFKLSDPLIHILAPGDTPVWDFDVVLTSRISQLPFMRNVAGREVGNYPKGTQRLFIGLEEMPVFSFRDTVSWASSGNMDLTSLAAYQSAGAVIINNLWSKREVMRIAKQWLTPSKALDLQKTIHECVPVKLSRLATNTIKMPGKGLNVVFAGRMTGTRNFKEVAELFRDHYAISHVTTKKQMNFIVSTNSASSGSSNVGEIDFMDVQHNNRDQFHALLKGKAHVVVNLSTVEDFSLSTYEPLLFGVPVIVPKHPWADFLGKDYPFRANDYVEAYAIVREFATDYKGQMAKFKQWESTTWRDLVESAANNPTLDVVKKLVDDQEVYLRKRLEQTDGGQMYKDLVAKIEATGQTSIDALAFAREQGVFVTNAAQFKGIPVGKRANAHLLKVYLNMAGWKDTNTPGVLSKN
jgi:hypothetical protein